LWSFDEAAIFSKISAFLGAETSALGVRGATGEHSMSKDFELMQQTGLSLGAAIGATKQRVGTEAKSQATTIHKDITQLEPSVREELMKLVQRLFLAPENAPAKAVMFTAIDAKNGCSRLCAATAGLLAQSISGSVCLVEGNFRTPSLAGMFGMENHFGLADALRREGPIRGFAKQVPNRKLWLLSSGSLQKDTLNLLNIDRLKERIEELRSEFDHLVFDVPPLEVYADAMVFGRLVDGALLVVEANSTRRESAMRVAENLRSTRIPVLGAVLNSRTFPIPGILYKRI
jgi:Mrp family chromosome partitioning ATPase